MRRAGGICSFLTIDQYLVTASPRMGEVYQYVASCHQSMPSPNDDIMHIFY